jgi:hypothetical protein
MLFETATKLQQTHFGNIEETENVLISLKMVLDTFDKHAEHEDAHVLPAIQKYDPALVDAFENEHIEDHALAEKLRTLIKKLENMPAGQMKIVTGVEILHSFIDFICFNLDHMKREETVLNEVLWRYYHDNEIAAINQSIIASIPIEEMAQTAAWGIRGLSNYEITVWLKEVQKNAPDIVFNTLFGLAEKELPYNRFRQILEDLTEGAMIA